MANKPASRSVATQSHALKTVTGTALSLAPDVDAEWVASQLVPSSMGSVAERARATAAMLETPYVSAKAIAEAGTVFTIINAATATVDKIGGRDGEQVEQVVFMVALQGDIDYIDSKGTVHEHHPGDVVLIGQARNKVRDLWFDLAKDAYAAGERLVNFQAYLRPSKTPGFAPAVAFRQLAS
jgi:hypothetical protein